MSSVFKHRCIVGKEVGIGHIVGIDKQFGIEGLRSLHGAQRCAAECCRVAVGIGLANAVGDLCGRDCACVGGSFAEYLLDECGGDERTYAVVHGNGVAVEHVCNGANGVFHRGESTVSASHHAVLCSELVFTAEVSPPIDEVFGKHHNNLAVGYGGKLLDGVHKHRFASQKAELLRLLRAEAVSASASHYYCIFRHRILVFYFGFEPCC